MRLRSFVSCWLSLVFSFVLIIRGVGSTLALASSATSLLPQPFLASIATLSPTQCFRQYVRPVAAAAFAHPVIWGKSTCVGRGLAPPHLSSSASSFRHFVSYLMLAFTAFSQPSVPLLHHLTLTLSGSGPSSGFIPLPAAKCNPCPFALRFWHPFVTCPYMRHSSGNHHVKYKCIVPFSSIGIHLFMFTLAINCFSHWQPAFVHLFTSLFGFRCPFFISLFHTITGIHSIRYSHIVA